MGLIVYDKLVYIYRGQGSMEHSRRTVAQSGFERWHGPRRWPIRIAYRKIREREVAPKWWRKLSSLHLGGCPDGKIIGGVRYQRRGGGLYIGKIDLSPFQCFVLLAYGDTALKSWFLSACGAERKGVRQWRFSCFFPQHSGILGHSNTEKNGNSINDKSAFTYPTPRVRGVCQWRASRRVCGTYLIRIGHVPNQGFWY